MTAFLISGEAGEPVNGEPVHESLRSGVGQRAFIRRFTGSPVHRLSNVHQPTEMA
jgi:hypothetical protein